MSTEMNPVDIEQSPQTDESIKVDLMKIDDNLKSTITCKLYDTLTDPECKKSKLSDVWETSNTPPLEYQEYDSLKVKKDLCKDDTINVDVVNDDDHLKKLHDTEKLGLCYRHTDDYEIYHSSIEKDICTELDNPMYIPIKLPLSSNLYVPVYYVQSSEESSPKLNKHNMDFNDSKNIHKDSNHNHHIKSMVSHKYLLNSHDNLSKQDESQRLASDYHININNQGYENCISKYDRTKPEPNPYDLEICNVQTELNEPLMNTKQSGKYKSKTNKGLLKQKLQFMKPKIKMNMNNTENEIVIPEGQRKIADESNRTEKRRKVGCSPKLKFKKYEHQNINDLEVMQRNDKPVEAVISGKQYKLPHVDSNNQLIENVTLETPRIESKKLTRKTKMHNLKKNEVKEKKVKTSKGVQKEKSRKPENRLGLTGKVCSPDVDVSVPSKKKFTFGWGSKGKKAKKVKLPTVSGDVDAGLDVGGKVDVPSVKVDVDSGDRVKGKKFHWSPNITLPKLKVHGPDVSGKLHADAPDVNVNVTGPSVKVPSVKASGHLPTVDVSVPDASLGGDLSGKLDLEGVGVGVVDADLNLPDLQISGNVSAPSVEGDLSMPDVSANLDTDVKLPSVQLTGPDLRVHGEMPDVDVDAKVDVPKPHISIKAPKFGFGLGKKKTKVKTPKADVKVEGGAGEEIDLDAGLDAHLDGKTRKGGKKFHWSPKFGLPKGGLKIGGGADGVDVSLPKPELDVSMEVPDVDVSASGPEIGVSGGAIRGGELGLTGKVCSPDVDVSVPSKKKFTFGWGSKGKKAKKVKLPTVSGDVDAGLDVGGKVDVPSVKVDVDSGDRVKGKKFHWSPNITLSKLKVHGPDVSGKLHADARNLNSNVTGTSELYNCVYSSMISSFPSSVDNSPSYILSDCCLSSEFLQSYAPASVVVVSDAGITSTMGTFSPPVFSSPTPTEPLEPVDLLPVVEEPLISPFSSPEFCDSSTLPSRILPRNAFQDIDESFSSPVDSGFNGDISNDEVEIDEIFIVPIQTNRVLPKEQYFTESQDILAAEAEEKSYHPAENLDASHGIKSDKTKLHSPFHIFKSKKHEKDSVHRVKVIDANDQISRNTEKPNVDNTHHSIPDGTGRNKVGSKSKKKVKSHHKKPRIFGGQVSTNEIISDTPMKLDHHEDYHDVIGLSFSDHNTDLTLTPRRSPSKLRDPSIRKTWHGAREPYSDFVGTLNSDQDKYTLTEDVSVSYLQPESNTKSSNNNSLNASDFLRRSIGNSTKRRPWSTLEYPPPGCHFVDDDYMFPDALTPTKIPSFRASKEIVYDVPYIDDKAIPRYEPEWPIGESRRTLISQLSQNSGSIVGMTAEEESSLISLDTKLSDHKNISKRISRFTSHLLKGNKSSLEQDDDDVSKPRSKSLTRLKTWWSKRNLPHK
uniref:Neuroblast differentiation-associated protein AHNAK n=1 Tax=Schistosoma mansoni TaxID=6183 RepID=A0A913KUR9_SCHMA